MTFLQIHSSGTVNEDGLLFINDKEVAIVYFRDGYTPENYTE